MALLDVAVLVGLPRLDRLGFEAVVRQKGLVPPGEQLGLRIGVDRRGQAIGAVPSGTPSQFPQGVLQPFAEALEALGEADRAGLPVGVGEHEVVDQVVERLSRDRDAEFGHMSEVTLGEPPRLMSLCEEYGTEKKSALLVTRCFVLPEEDPLWHGSIGNSADVCRGS